MALLSFVSMILSVPACQLLDFLWLWPADGTATKPSYVPICTREIGVIDCNQSHVIFVPSLLFSGTQLTGKKRMVQDEERSLPRSMQEESEGE
jgi:hypothetical protein